MSFDQMICNLLNVIWNERFRVQCQQFVNKLRLSLLLEKIKCQKVHSPIYEWIKYIFRKWMISSAYPRNYQKSQRGIIDSTFSNYYRLISIIYSNLFPLPLKMTHWTQGGDIPPKRLIIKISLKWKWGS